MMLLVMRADLRDLENPNGFREVLMIK